MVMGLGVIIVNNVILVINVVVIVNLNKLLKKISYIHENSRIRSRQDGFVLY